MKSLLPFALAAVAAVLLFSSCVYDPLSTGYYGSSNYSNSGYSGGYYNGVYSDVYIGFSNDYYRYRHTRCSHCNHYPCRGGHSPRYYTYYRNYHNPLYGHPGRGDRRSYASHRSNRPRGAQFSQASYRAPRSHGAPAYNRDRSQGTRIRTGDNFGDSGTYRDSSSRSRLNRPVQSSSPRYQPSNLQRSRGATPERSSPRSSSPQSRDDRDRSNSPRRLPENVVSNRPSARSSDALGDSRSASRGQRTYTPVSKQTSPSRGKSSSATVPSRSSERVARGSGASSSTAPSSSSKRRGQVRSGSRGNRGR